MTFKRKLARSNRR